MLTEHNLNQLKNIIRLFYPNTQIKTTVLDSIVVFEVEEIKIKCDITQNIYTGLYEKLRLTTGKDMPWGNLTGIRPTRLVYKEVQSLRGAKRRSNLTLSRHCEEQSDEAIPCSESVLSVGLLRRSAPRNDIELALTTLKEKYFVSDKKIKLLKDVITAQQGYMTRGDKLINYYINIPVCPSRCNYCSFPSTLFPSEGGVGVGRQMKTLDEYAECLCEEIKRDGGQLRNSGYTVYSIYIGGGTPTVLNEKQLESVLKSITTFLPLPYTLPPTEGGYKAGVEFTCEAGRPDTITAPKLALLKKYGVTRICINPQSFNDATLKAIGRSHTEDDFQKAYRLADEYGFILNTDLIAGLADEGIKEFEYSLNKAIELSPHNITVHTLSHKRGSENFHNLSELASRANCHCEERSDEAIPCKESGIPVGLLRRSAPRNDGKYDEKCSDNEAHAMVDLAYQKLTSAGYIPYYLYRQKSQKGALENVGYTKPGFQCINNISVMEETISVLASGAGAISKRIATGSDNKNNPITRYANCKEIGMYTAEFEERYKAKRNFFFASP